MKVRTKNSGCGTSQCVQNPITVLDEGITVASATVIDFQGNAVAASKGDGKVVVTINSTGGGGGGSQFMGDYTQLQSAGMPTDASAVGSGTAGALVVGDTFRIVLNNANDEYTDGDIQILNHYLIIYMGSGSWSIQQSYSYTP